VRCATPYAQDESALGDAGPEAGSDAGAEAGADGATELDAATDQDAAQVDAAPCCDCDDDGVPGPQCDAGPPGSVDCNDLDPRTHPDAGFVTAAPKLADGGDWNCNGTVEVQYPPLECPGVCPTPVGLGPKGVVPCGAMLSLFRCQNVGGVCSGSVAAGTATQGCR
jgi:hypothetical protein